MSLIYFKPGGVLLKKKWNPTSRRHEMVDCTENAEFVAHAPLVLAGATLGDMFKLMAAVPALVATQKNNFVDEFLEEVAKGPLPPQKDGEDPESAIEYLELYRIWSLHSRKGELDIGSRLQFHGIGVERKTDNDPIYPAGTRTQWGITGSSVRQLLSLPLKLKHEVIVTEADMAKRSYGSEVAKYTCTDLTLMSLIDSVMWELSFHGGPRQTEEFVESLIAQVEDSRALRELPPEDPPRLDSDGTVIPRGCVSHEEVFGGLYHSQAKAVFESYEASASALIKVIKKLADDENGFNALNEKFSGQFKLKPGLESASAYELRTLIYERLSSDDSDDDEL